MVSAIVASGLFLTFYLIYHFLGDPKVYVGDYKIFYLIFLASHIILAATIPFGIILLLKFIWKNDIESHKKYARIVWPIWVYVSLTGIMIFFWVHVI